MEPLRVYVDTSVFGGYFDEEFAELTVPFFQAILRGDLVPLVSDTLLTEVAAAPSEVRALLDEVLPLAEWLPLTAAVVALQRAYLDAGIVGPRYADDALHVALATAARAQAVVSWNLRHMVDPRKARQYNSVNLSQGYGLMTVVTPVDVSKLRDETNDPNE